MQPTLEIPELVLSLPDTLLSSSWLDVGPGLETQSRTRYLRLKWMHLASAWEATSFRASK